MRDKQPIEPRPALRPAELMATAAMIAMGTSAYADVVRYDNPDGAGHHHWPFGILDVTKSAAEQPGFGSLGDPTTSYQGYFSDFYPQFSYATTYQSGGGMGIFSSGFSDNYAAPLAAGTIVGPGLAGGSFTSGTVFEYEFDACELVYVGYPCYCYYYKNCESGSRGIIPEGVETYLGVRFDVGSGPQYGWVKVVRSYVEIDALAWGYETEPNTPIRVGAAPCDADVDGDGDADFTDLLSLLTNWGTDAPGAELAVPFDVIDFADLLALLQSWGPCPVALGPASPLTPPEGSLAALAHGASPAA